jgi:hypothetical protein
VEPHLVEDACLECTEKLRRLSHVFAEVRRCYPETAQMADADILKRLWAFRWQRRRET